MLDLAPQERRWALFLDVDGTLLEIAETPQGVYVSDSLRQLLSGLRARLDGALALISGRSIDNLDQLFDPLRLCSAGVHGCERRDMDGTILRPELDPTRIEPVRRQLTGFVNARKGLLLEDKGFGLAVHFRLAPRLGEEVHYAMLTALERLGPDFVLQAGKFVFEIRPAAWTKGSSIAAFMQQQPFKDRVPIFIGDDVTDEHGFEVVNALDGISIRVGDASATLARHRLASVTDVIQWLQRMPRQDISTPMP